MQGPIEFVRHGVATLIFAVHALLAMIVPHLFVAAPTQTPVAADIHMEATTSPAQVFPVAKSKTAATSTTQKTTTTVTKPQQNPVASSQTTSEGSAQAQQQASVPALSQSEVNSMARAALVNIVCTSQSGGVQYFITGSGVLISGTGVILTNAHAAQYFLLNEGVQAKEDCVIRTGSPAAPVYRAELLYLPPAWIAANAKEITADVGTGTGEHDYAFLRITGTTDPRGTLPASFPHIPITLNEPDRDEPILIASYPAGYLKSAAVESNLYQATAITTVKEIYAFNSEGNADIVSLGSPIVAQAGSSGGGVVRMYDGALQALVAIATEGSTTDARELRGITLSHIDRSLRAQGVGGLIALLSGDLKQKAADFAATTALTERQQLLNALKK